MLDALDHWHNVVMQARESFFGLTLKHPFLFSGDLQCESKIWYLSTLVGGFINVLKWRTGSSFSVALWPPVPAQAIVFVFQFRRTRRYSIVA